MSFRKYMHVEKFGGGNFEVEGIEAGTVHVFPKLDGTNASLWWDKETIEMGAGSRNRQLFEGNDNAGFCTWAFQQENLQDFFQDHNHLRLYGEWLVPHTIKGYREDAWRNFYVFDVVDQGEDILTGDPMNNYVHFDHYRSLLEEYDINLIHPIAVVKNGGEKKFTQLLERNTYLMEDGAGLGEGIVIKNYEYRNRYGRQCWAKLIRAEFKEDHVKAMGVSVEHGQVTVEALAAEKFVTPAFVKKERAKIELVLTEEFAAQFIDDKTKTAEDWDLERANYLSQKRGKLIPRLLQTCYYEIVREHAWDIAQLASKHGGTLNYKDLKTQVTYWVKKHASDLF